METIGGVIGDYEGFVDEILKGLDDKGIDLDSLQIDHIAYRVETMERYAELKEELSEFGELALEELVRDRPIAMFELDEPLEAGGYEIDYLELPAPSDHQAYPEGLEHIDFVIDCSLEEFMAQYPALTFKTEGMQKESHPEISLKVGDYNAKFCSESIGEEIARQKGE